MRSLTLLVAIATLSLKALADDPIADRVDRKIRLQAATAAVRDLIAQLSGPPAARRTESLAVKIGQSSKSHQDKSKSRRIAEQLVQTQIRQEFETNFRQILEKANRGAKRGITSQQLKNHIGDVKRLVGQATARFIASHYSSMFSEARSRAVSRQRSQLKLRIEPPSQSVIDKALKSNPNWTVHRAQLSASLRKKATPEGLVLFEENHDAINSAVDRVLGEIGDQYRNQLSAVDTIVSNKRVPRQYITADLIQRYASGELRNATQASQRKYVKKYGVFEVVTDKVTTSAVRLELDRLRQFIDKAELPVTSQSITDAIESSLREHRVLRESLKILEASLISPCSRTIAPGYVNKSGLVGVDRESAHRRVADLLKTEDVANLVRVRLRKDLQSISPGARSGIATRQSAERFPALSDQWRPSVNDISAMYDAGGPPLDFVKCVRLLQGRADAKVNREQLLAETEQLVTRRVHDRANVGVKALRAQLQLLSQMERNRARQLTLDVAAGVDKKRIIKTWETAIADAWSHSEYQELFGRTQIEIEKTISRHYDSIRKEVAERRRLGGGRDGSREGPDDAPVALKKKMIADDAEQVPGSVSVSLSRVGGTPGGGNGAGGAGGGGGGGGGRGGGSGNGDDEPGDRDADKAGEGGGDGPPPDCTLVFENETTPGSCLARLRARQYSVPATRLRFDPLTVADSASLIADAVWPGIEAVLTQKHQAREGQEPFSLRIHVSVRTDEVRHRMSLLMRSRIEAHSKAWISRNLNLDKPVAVHWSDSVSTR